MRGLGSGTIRGILGLMGGHSDFLSMFYMGDFGLGERESYCRGVWGFGVVCQRIIHQTHVKYLFNLII